MFLHKFNGKTVGLCLKVMYSFFARHPAFVSIAPDIAPDFFICRNPYARCVSLFFDKCRARAEGEFVQVNQGILVEALGLKSKQDLATVNFYEFCAVLERILYEDEHFWPQTSGLRLARKTHVVQLESPMAQLKEAFPDVDFSKKENATEHQHWHCYFSTANKPLIERAYQADFTQFHYPT